MPSKTLEDYYESVTGGRQMTLEYDEEEHITYEELPVDDRSNDSDNMYKSRSRTKQDEVILETENDDKDEIEIYEDLTEYIEGGGDETNVPLEVEFEATSEPQPKKLRLKHDGTNIRIVNEQKKQTETVVSQPQTQIQSANAALCQCKTDADAMFLMSLLPDFKSTTNRNKYLLKVKIQQLFQEILFPE